MSPRGAAAACRPHARPRRAGRCPASVASRSSARKSSCARRAGVRVPSRRLGAPAACRSTRLRGGCPPCRVEASAAVARSAAAPPWRSPVMRASRTSGSTRRPRSSATKSSTASSGRARPEADLLDQAPAVDREPVAQPGHRLRRQLARGRTARPAPSAAPNSGAGTGSGTLARQPQQPRERDAALARDVHRARAPAAARPPRAPPRRRRRARTGAAGRSRAASGRRAAAGSA